MNFNESGAALAAARREIANRLRAVCDYCTDAEFDRLVGHIAAIELKYQMRDIIELLYPSSPSSGMASLATGVDPGSEAGRSEGMNSAA